MGDKNPKTSNVALCLKAIKDYVNPDEEAKKVDLSKREENAKKALEQLSLLFEVEAENVALYHCPSDNLPTI